MALTRGQYASADGPYVRADGTEVPLWYLETVIVLKPANENGEVYVTGLDSHNSVWILESSLTPQIERPAGWTP